MTKSAPCTRAVEERRVGRWLCSSCCNAQVIYESQSGVPKLKRLNFLKSIAENLNQSNLMTRLHSSRLPRQIRSSISSDLKKEIPKDTSHSESRDKVPRTERKYCYLCHYKKRTKNAHLCTKCLKPVCLTCLKKDMPTLPVSSGKTHCTFFFCIEAYIFVFLFLFRIPLSIKKLKKYIYYEFLLFL